jgi:hypothetical protein
VAGIGDEVGAHARQPVLLRQIPERDQKGRAIAHERGRGVERHHRRQEPALYRYASVQLHGLRPARGQRLFDGRQKPGVATHGGDVASGAARAELLLGAAVGVDDASLRVERDRRLRNGVDHQAPEALRVAAGLGRGALQGLPGGFVGGPECGQESGGGETDERHRRLQPPGNDEQHGKGQRQAERVTPRRKPGEHRLRKLAGPQPELLQTQSELSYDGLHRNPHPRNALLNCQSSTSAQGGTGGEPA